jgi:PKD repeat protein
MLDFGDGTTSIRGEGPLAVSHTYDAGTYSATLTIVFAGGGDTRAKAITAH